MPLRKLSPPDLFARYHIRHRARRPALSEVASDVLTWLMFGLDVWLGIGVLTAWLVFGAFGEPTSRELD